MTAEQPLEAVGAITTFITAVVNPHVFQKDGVANDGAQGRRLLGSK